MKKKHPIKRFFLLLLLVVLVAALAVMLACPTAVSGYTLANQCGADGELAAQLIVVTTLFSVITMFLTIWLLTSMVLI